MLVLFETPAGYAIFKLLDEKKLAQTDNLYLDFETPEAASKIVKLKHFEKFVDTTEALAATTATVEGKLGKGLKKLLKKLVGKELQEQLLVADAKLGNAIKDKLNVTCLSNTSVQELMRCIRSQMDGLLAGFPKKEMTAMALGLAHSLSRYKLKFSPDKVDTMIVQAVCLLDDLDKELNKYVMRCREWYGWHFPELGKIVTDHVAFARTIKIIGTRDCVASADLSDILPEEVEEQVKEAAEVSMGTEISEEDVINIQNLCDQIIEMTGYRTQLFDYLRARMMAIAPNLTVLVGELVGARLISHSGSLINLAKQPASTIQILGAEKALFRALKSKRDTPKYGLLYHAGLVGMSSTANKGKISRMLAAKAALATRVDALGEDSTSIDLGAEHKVKIEKRIQFLEEGKNTRISGTGRAKARFEKYHGKSEIRQYPVSADSTLPSAKRTFDDAFGNERKVLIEELASTEAGTSETPVRKPKKVKVEPYEADVVVKQEGEKKIKKKRKRELEEAEEEEEELEDTPAAEEGKKKKKKKLLSEETEAVLDVSGVVKSEGDYEGKKMKKKKKHQVTEEQLSGDQSFGTAAMFGSPEELGSPRKKKKSVKVEAVDDSSPPPAALPVDSSQSGKKKKKKKQLVLGLDGVQYLSTPTADDQGQASEPEEGASQVVSEKKKKKKSFAAIDDSYVATPSHQEPEEGASQVVSEKKKKKKSIAMAADISVATPSHQEPEEGASQVVSEKKKKKKSIAMAADISVATPSHQEPEEGALEVVSEKKKKKKSIAMAADISVATPLHQEPEEGASQVVSEKKKKKKSIAMSVHSSVATPSHQEPEEGASQVVSGEKKKKKKKTLNFDE